jgi:iron(III) transport system ATP-binding protein
MAEDAFAVKSIALGAAGISHAYGARKVVDDVTLTVAPGELVCLVGPSGCGKTTLLRIVAGLEELQQGRIVIDGCAVAEPGYVVPPEARGVGFVFQDYALFPHLTVAGNVAFGLNRLAATERAKRVDEVLAQVGMSEYAAVYPHQLSGGQQQRVALARALAPRPRVMLLDEPFSGLDARLREQIRDDALHVLKDSGTATLMVTHDPEEAMFMADRLAVMRAGRIEQEGSPVDVYVRPATAFVAAFFGQVNELHGQVRDGAVTTPFGVLQAPGLSAGSAVNVLIRPEALRLTVAGDGRTPAVQARVMAARLLGRSSWIHLSLLEPPADERGGPREGQAGYFHFHARVPGRFLPREGEVLAVGLDPSQAFVFPSGDPS